MAIIPLDEKVFMVNNTTNTIYSGSAALKAMQKWYTMEDVSNTVKPYKVFTALLTQSGGSDPSVQAGDGTFYKGVTYQIILNTNNEDLTLIGAPSNNVGTYFVCSREAVEEFTAEVELSWNQGAPVATVLENTIGNIWFTYNDVGYYSVNSNGLFITDKTYIDFGGFYNAENWVNIYGNSNLIDLMGSNNGSLFNTPIEIRFYN